MEIINKALQVGFVIFLMLILCGCIQQNDQKDTDVNGEKDGTETRYDPCGNEIGNGNEIISGPSGPEDHDIDNPFRSLTVHPTDSDILIIGTERNGFVKSIDGGSSWMRLRKGLRHKNSGYPEIYDIAFSQKNPDIIYATRIQKERMSPEERNKFSYEINRKTLDLLPERTKIMHPLPRVDELNPEIDSNSRVIPFKQVRYGLQTRMAILALLLGHEEKILALES